MTTIPPFPKRHWPQHRFGVPVPLAASLLLSCAQDPAVADAPRPAPTTAPTNAAPLLTVRLEPATIAAYEPLSCIASATDPEDGELEVTVRWWRDGSPMEELPNPLPARVVAPGEVWRCEATATDALGEIGVGEAVLELPPASRENLLILVADDLGIDNVGVYDHVPNPPPTPHIDELAASGIRFDNAFVYSLCSPTRAALMTGRFGTRTGATALIGLGSQYELPLEELTLPELLGEGYASSAMGKWHLGWVEGGPSGPSHAHDQGFDWWEGSRANLDADGVGYTSWTKWVDGAQVTTELYATTDTTNDAIERIGAMEEPWLAYVAFNAPHYPFELPPEGLYPQMEARLDGSGSPPIPRIYDAMVEALDTEIGRLLEGIPAEVYDRTTVVFIGDNGTPRDTTTLPMDWERAKQSPYAGGTHVPLIVSGPQVQAPGEVTESLVHAVDLFPTLGEIAGVSFLDLGLVEELGGVALDGESLLPYLADPAALGRDCLFNEHYRYRYDLEKKALRGEYTAIAQDHDYKLIARRTAGVDELYDLSEDDVTEGTDRLGPDADPLTADEQAAYARLQDCVSDALARIDWVPLK